jgi:hypothetical protein
MDNNYLKNKKINIQELCSINIENLFNTNQNKIVCYPSTWFGPTLQKNSITDLCPPEWCCL